MEPNTFIADLEFVGSIIKNISVENSISMLPNPTRITMQVGSEPSMVRTIDDDGVAKYEQTLLLLVELGILDEAENKVTDIKIMFEGCFRAPMGMNVTDFENAVKISGLTGLFSIARAEIVTLTSHIFIEGKVTLPMINIYEYYKNKESAPIDKADK